MPLPLLVPGQSQVDVQQTAFGIDAVARYVCNTWEEATGHGGPPFDAVIVGAGMYGAYCAAKIFRLRPGKRVLLLDAGQFLVTEHIQNLAAIGFGFPGAIPPASDPGVARDLVWGIPWRGNADFPGLAYCLGGKSLYWGGWCPRLTPGDLAGWPTATAEYLDATYRHVEEETGVEPATDFITGSLHNALRAACIAATPGIPNIELGIGTNGVETAPLAVQGESPESGLFSFDKYSSMPVLTQAIREDARLSQGNDANRRLFLVPRAHVTKLTTSGGTVTGVEVFVDGAKKTLSLPQNGIVILAASAIETTRIALLSFPEPLMGRNLMGHLRSDFTVRIRRAVLPAAGNVETGALLIRGAAPSGRFHLQLTASAHPAGSDELLFRMIPDLDFLEPQLLNDDPTFVTLTLRGIGEMHGDRTAPVPNAAGSWINLSPFEVDEFGVPRAFVQIQLGPGDLQTWQAMDKAALDLAQAVAGNAGNIEYLYEGGWKTAPFPLDRPFPEWHRGLGSTYHESGTLWMGDDPASSVTDPIGRFHRVANCYACDQSLFPTAGSVNPVLTGLTLARGIAERAPM